jgi:hypothetical protein
MFVDFWRISSASHVLHETYCSLIKWFISGFIYVSPFLLFVFKLLGGHVKKQRQKFRQSSIVT